MNYTSVEEIQKKFQIQSQDLGEIRKELKELLKPIHPDNNNGNFKSEEDKEYYHQISEAIQFIDAQSKKVGALITRSEFDQLAILIKDLLPKIQVAEPEKELSDRIDRDIKLFKRRHNLPKIAVSTIVSILSFIWIFPKAVQSQPILATYIKPDNPFFISIWLTLLVFTGVYWVVTILRENRQEEDKRQLKLEIIQNQLFHEFLELNNYKTKEPKQTFLRFKKQEFINYLSGYDTYNRLGFYNPNVMDLVKRELRLRKEIGRIDLELAQSLADVIIQRALSKGIIEKETKKSISDIFIFRYDDTDLN